MSEVRTLIAKLAAQVPNDQYYRFVLPNVVSSGTSLSLRYSPLIRKDTTACGHLVFSLVRLEILGG